MASSAGEIAKQALSLTIKTLGLAASKIGALLSNSEMWRRGWNYALESNHHYDRRNLKVLSAIYVVFGAMCAMYFLLQDLTIGTENAPIVIQLSALLAVGSGLLYWARKPLGHWGLILVALIGLLSSVSPVNPAVLGATLFVLIILFLPFFD